MSDRVGASTQGDSSEGKGLHSPKKLQRSIWNQVVEVPVLNSPHQHLNSSLSLRSINLAPSLPAILHQCKPHASHITSVDVSYSILDGNNISALCAAFSKLQSFCAVSCGLEELESDMVWPRGLKRVDLSRNKLMDFPSGIGQLLHLEVLNVSGNRIHTVNLAVLRLPMLQILHLLNNPIHNVPKHICREGVCKMRRYLNIEPMPIPVEDKDNCMQSQSKIHSLSFKNLLLQYGHRHVWSESTESGYNSPSQRLFSSCSSLTDQEDEELDFQLPMFTPCALPEGYTQACNTPLCQIYLPAEYGQNVYIEIVKDLSFHPQVCSNELLVTPVVRITPHGLTFPSDRPAIVVLSHCTWPNSQEVIVPLCSNTGPNEPPTWTKLESGCYCEVFRDCITFSTTHFSLFAAVSVLPYPSTKADINNEGGILTLPELPGFQVHFPPDSVHTDISITVQATVYYADHIKSDHNLSLATACVGLEPHGMEFRTPVLVSIPIPDFAAIKTSFQDAQLQLWTSPYIDEHTLHWQHWQHVPNAHISVQEGVSGHIATFQVNHFSFFELLWTICRDTLQTLGYGASLVYRHLPSRTRYVSIRCQVFMSQPLDDQTFGLLVAVYKFGEPLSTLSNYKWMLADTGSKHTFLKTGELHVSLEGCFEPRRDVGETVLSRRAEIQFAGEDFCLRFEFALRLRDVLFPLVDHQIIGKLYIRQWDGTTPVELNLIKPSEGSTFIPQTPATTPTMLQQAEQFMDFTPPWSPDSDYQDSPTYTLSNDHSTPTRQGKHRRTSYVDHTGTGIAVRVKRRLLVREGQIGDKSDRFLMEVAHSVGPKWEEVGVALDLDFDTVTSVIGSRDGGASEHLKAFHMLQEWKRRAALDFTFTRLASALEEAGLNSCAQRHCYIEHSEKED